ncbi:MAG: HDOD domain-containing protein [Clostridia bacterium]|nr:HDOD domain-containing protein [Clostridia bacterium]
MSMLISPLPHFSADMEVTSYWLDSHNGKKLLGVKDNFLRMDEAFSHPGLDAVERIGIEPFTGGVPLFVPLSRVQLLSGLIERNKLEPEQLVICLEAEDVTDLEAANALAALRERGHRIAVTGMPDLFNTPALPMIDYIILSILSPTFASDYADAGRHLSRKTLIISDIPNMETFEGLRRDRSARFTGPFYNRPITRRNATLTPIKINALQLLNQINHEDFELEEIVRTIEQDPYLTVSLLRFLNSTASGLKNRVSSIRQAVTILGQNAVRQWAAIALSATLGEDRPSEITRLALVRARFAEDIAGAFELGTFRAPLFMAGLFSLLDVMLEKPLAEAIEEVAVTDQVRQALVEHTGPLWPVLEMVYAYEHGDWDKVSILMIRHHTDLDRISQAYLDALVWYRQLLKAIDSAGTAEDEI